MLEKKLHIAKEFLETEKNYIVSINKLQKTFLNPFKESRLLIDQVYNKIFHKDIALMMTYNEELLENLTSVINQDMNYYSPIGSVLLQIVCY